MNRLPSKTIDGKYPFDLVFHMKHLFDHLKVIDCLCYMTNLKKNYKFSARAILTVLLGIFYGAKGL